LHRLAQQMWGHCQVKHTANQQGTQATMRLLLLAKESYLPRMVVHI